MVATIRQQLETQQFAVANLFCHVTREWLQFNEYVQDCFTGTQLCEEFSANAMASSRLWGHG